jgi:hypothetical protein
MTMFISFLLNKHAKGKVALGYMVMHIMQYIETIQGRPDVYFKSNLEI